MGLIFAASVAAAVLLRPSEGLVALQHAIVLDQPRLIGPFELVDQDHRPFTRDHLEGQWSLVFIGFTHCPDICPTTLHLLTGLQSRLEEGGLAFAPVFISVDPERDTPDELARYAGFFGSDLVAASGSKDQLDALCSDLDFGYVKVPLSQGAYTVDHSGALALVDTRARVRGYFLPPFDIDHLAADMARVLR